MSPVQSRGPPMMESQIRIGSSAMPSWGHKCGRKCYVSPAFSGVPNKWEPNQNCLPQPRGIKSQLAASHAFSGVQKLGECATSPPCSRGSPTKGNKIRIGCLSHAFSGAQKWLEVLCYPCIRGGPQQRGKESEVAAVAVPSRVPNRGRRCDVTRAFSGAPDNGSAFSGAQMCTEVLCHPCILGGPY